MLCILNALSEQNRTTFCRQPSIFDGRGKSPLRWTLNSDPFINTNCVIALQEYAFLVCPTLIPAIVDTTPLFFRRSVWSTVPTLFSYLLVGTSSRLPGISSFSTFFSIRPCTQGVSSFFTLCFRRSVEVVCLLNLNQSSLCRQYVISAMRRPLGALDRLDEGHQSRIRMP